MKGKPSSGAPPKAKPFWQDIPGPLQPQTMPPPRADGGKRPLHVVPAGQAPPQTGAPGVPHGVLPVGMQPHVFSGEANPELVHVSPAGHAPLHVGFVCPHGIEGDTQWQTEEKPSGTQVSPAAQPPPHVG